MKKRSLLISFAVGVLFALGLGMSGMTQPQKIVAFLDIAGYWDPSLMFVMVGAIAVHGVAYFFIKKRNSPLLESEFRMPTANKITKRLIIGSSIFGIGWGMAGFCPGPSLTAIASGHTSAILFVLSMIGGMYAFRFFEKLKLIN